MPCRARARSVKKGRATLTAKSAKSAAAKRKYGVGGPKSSGAKQRSPTSKAASPLVAHDDPRFRGSLLRQNADKEYLYIQEALYIFLYHFFNGRRPPRVASAIVIPIDDPEDAADAFLNNVGHEHGAMIYSAEATHFCAVYCLVSKRDGRMRLALYDPMKTVSNVVQKMLQDALAIVNGNRGEDDVLSTGVGWQKVGGPCGVYSAFILRCLTAGGADPAGSIEPSECPHPPTIAAIRLEYAWLADNLETSQRRYYASL